jgi:hypothetical protein
MTDVERLLTEYKQAHQGDGDADPRPYLARVSGVDRELLAGLIDAYLAEAPRRPFSAAAFAESRAAPVADEVERSLAGAGGIWPVLLPRLRDRARLRRSELVAQLAARLGAQGQQEKVGLYYHQMEQGLLPESGVSETVLDALAKIVDTTASALRKAGQMPTPGTPRTDEGAVFARATYGEPAADMPAEAEELAARERRADEWDEVDRLFRGGA